MMSRRTNNRAIGFTLVEVMIAGLLVAIALAGAMGGIRAISRAESRARDAELLQRLAQEKIEDLKLLSDPTQAGAQGDFSDRGYPDITWDANVSNTSITNVDQVTITAKRGDESQSLTTQVYVPPATSTNASTTSAGAEQ